MTEQTPKPEIREGQIWQEVDPRFPNLVHKEVLGFDSDGRVLLRPVGMFSRTTLAKPERFNGKRSGYRLISDVPSDA
jgi:hypothetical protein